MLDYSLLLAIDELGLVASLGTSDSLQFLDSIRWHLLLTLLFNRFLLFFLVFNSFVSENSMLQIFLGVAINLILVLGLAVDILNFILALARANDVRWVLDHVKIVLRCHCLSCIVITPGQCVLCRDSRRSKPCGGLASHEITGDIITGFVPSSPDRRFRAITPPRCHCLV